MRFSEVVMEFAKGAKIRRQSWKENNYWHMENGELKENGGRVLNDWEIVKEDTWNLSNLKQEHKSVNNIGFEQTHHYFYIDDVKTLKQKILEDISKNSNMESLKDGTHCYMIENNNVRTIIQKRFGI